ncbi:exported hypothetical protein [Stenotrophomonas thermophila]|nr:exported hypothetical protein [Stenotrophomonas maltophilia]
MSQSEMRLLNRTLYRKHGLHCPASTLQLIAYPRAARLGTLCASAGSSNADSPVSLPRTFPCRTD